MNTARIWFEATRPRTLPAAVAPVLVGTALAVRVTGDVIWPAALACLGFALLIQIGTNFANDYYDFIKGADTSERIGPRRAVASGLVKPVVMRWVAAVTFLAAFAVGLCLLPYGGWPLLVVGVMSILCGYAYTGGPYPLGYNGLGDIFVFIFFGLIAVGATTYVQTGVFGLEALVVGTGVGGLAANILVVNNYRDVETDAKAGKRTLVVRYGLPAARRQFMTAQAVAALVPLLLVALLGVDLILAVILSVMVTLEGWRQTVELAAADTPVKCITLLGKVGRWLAIYALLLSIVVLLP